MANEAKQPLANPSSSNAARELSRVAGDPLYQRPEASSSTWAAGGVVKYPTDPAEIEELEKALERLSHEHSSHVRVPAEPLELLEKPLKNGVRIAAKHLPGALNDYARGQILLWKEQKRARCSEPGCFYPVTPKLLEREAHNPIVFPSEEGGKVIAGECSWEPRHAGGLQWIPVRKPGDE